MGKFDYLDTQRVTSDDLSEVTLYTIMLPNGKNPTLIGKHAGDSNKPYMNALLQGSTKQRKLIQNNIITVGMLDENRDNDRVLFPIHVLTGWKDVCGGDGKDVEFSRDECADFIAALPNDAFDEVRNHFGNAANFRDIITPEEAIAKGKN